MTIGWWDRLRIERLVWMLDQQLYDLPREARIATRREVRANLVAASADVGTSEALRRIGGSRGLAEQYLRAEFGDRPRHSWIAAGYAAGLFPLLLNFFLSEAANAFQAGVTAAHGLGAFTWPGVAWVQTTVTVTVTGDGQASRTGGAWTPLAFVLWALAVIAFGRLWRLRRRSSQVARSATDN
ncbi:hypothetical protein GCM10010168_48230 [Actinoplanes ianthinogenes]|uniref:Uncharacterized protein n=1 Tax=Actinoplanes ianthinogenes TaxID=122358 RepID=A0ABM7LNM0_9ACTN|nr:hypothetical protein [Actinoplanes ianthinogenes]BCJ40877.1 hypothetical protein Aiant_15340 [Actinoplanes ianthinogenes]GGR24553.1 hypothetical protein GCM10010168_48230 [Actinoplanes ianthinogenes]